MKNNQSLWWPFSRSGNHSSETAEIAIFGQLRTRLTLWYCGVLGATLLLFGITLYFGAQYFLLTSVKKDAIAHAQAHISFWQAHSLTQACPFINLPGRPSLPPAPAPNEGFSEIVLCFTPDGSLLPNESMIGLSTTLLPKTLSVQALQKGSAFTSLDGGPIIGPIYCYAQPVPGPTGQQRYQGVVLVIESIRTQEVALSLLLTLLLILGILALLSTGLGGLFLASRALVPTHLAWANQQRFVADASHELRTPLALLRADAEVLLRHREVLAVEDVLLLEDIVTETKHMARLSNDMLTLARLDSNPAHHEHEVVNLTEIAQNGARRVQALADQAQVTIEILLPTLDAPAEGKMDNLVITQIQQEARKSPLVIGDSFLLEQALLTLLDNAIKYNRPAGGVTIQVGIKQGYAQLEIADTGIGISAEQLPHLGERFYRADKARSRAASGTGLGLSIAQSIATTHGGKLVLTSVLNQGTTATLSLPLARTTRAPSNEAPENVPSQ